MIKWIGAVLIVAGCGGMGFIRACAYRMEERMLEELGMALEYMSCELSYQMTPLPQLCRKTANLLRGRLKPVFLSMAEELDRQVAPDAPSCMGAVLAGEQLPDSVRKILARLGSGMGCFDLPGQIRGIEGCAEQTQSVRRELADHRQDRIRSYQTLGICAGAALAILLL